jgi:polysaccharide pyruvyl transferase WcaK-like protein
MKKAAIITLLGYFNYGQRLQNYATTRILRKMGYRVETLCFRQPKNRNKYLKRFTEKLIKIRHVDNLDVINKDYDLVVIGSDQVFNYKYLLKAMKRKNNLVSAVKKVDPEKLVAFSASFGTSNIPPEIEQMFTDHLNRYNAISVREDAGAEIVKRLTGQEPLVLVDPVLAADGWYKLASKKYSGSYVFNYFVDGVNMIPSYEKEIAALAEEYGARVETIKRMPVSDFLSAIKNARLLVTNSYHGVCMAIIYKTPFILLEDRAIMSSRFETLFNKLGIDDRMITEPGRLMDIPLKMDYRDITPRLKKERRQALEFLKGAIK